MDSLKVLDLQRVILTFSWRRGAILKECPTHGFVDISALSATHTDIFLAQRGCDLQSAQRMDSLTFRGRRHLIVTSSQHRGCDLKRVPRMGSLTVLDFQHLTLTFSQRRGGDLKCPPRMASLSILDFQHLLLTFSSAVGSSKTCPTH